MRSAITVSAIKMIAHTGTKAAQHQLKGVVKARAEVNLQRVKVEVVAIPPRVKERGRIAIGRQAEGRTRFVGSFSRVAVSSGTSAEANTPNQQHRHLRRNPKRRRQTVIAKVTAFSPSTSQNPKQRQSLHLL